MNCIRCHIPTARSGYCSSCGRTTVAAVSHRDSHAARHTHDTYNKGPWAFSPYQHDEGQAWDVFLRHQRLIKRRIIATAEAIRRMAERDERERSWFDPEQAVLDAMKRDFGLYEMQPAEPSQDEPIPYRLSEKPAGLDSPLAIAIGHRHRDEWRDSVTHAALAHAWLYGSLPLEEDKPHDEPISFRIRCYPVLVGPPAETIDHWEDEPCSE